MHQRYAGICRTLPRYTAVTTLDPQKRGSVAVAILKGVGTFHYEQSVRSPSLGSATGENGPTV